MGVHEMTHSAYESGAYLDRNPEWHAGDAPTKARWIREMLAANRVSPNTIVEVGTGSGEILVHLAGEYPDATLKGYDISPQAYAIASPKSTDQLAFYHEDFLEADTGEIDLLMAIDVFEHVEDYIGFIRALRSRATFKLFHVPLDLSVQGVLRANAIPSVREKLGHLHYFTKDSALAALRDTGYDIVAWNYTHGTEELPNRAVRTRLTNVARRALRALAGDDLCVRVMGGASIMVLTR